MSDLNVMPNCTYNLCCFKMATVRIKSTAHFILCFFYNKYCEKSVLYEYFNTILNKLCPLTLSWPHSHWPRMMLLDLSRRATTEQTNYSRFILINIKNHSTQPRAFTITTTIRKLFISDNFTVT